MVARKVLQQILLVCALAAGIAACSSGGNGSSSGASSSPSSAPSSSAPASSSGAAATITKNWETFFNAKTATAKRVTLLQDGSALEPVIKAQSGSSLASTASAKVTKVTVVSPTKATVKYNILIGGTPALSNQTGVAVYQAGTWKVGLASFCGLLTVENGGKTSSLPSVCKSAG